MRASDDDLLQSYLDGALSDAAASAVEQRLIAEPALCEHLLDLSCEETVLWEWSATCARRAPSAARPGRGRAFKHVTRRSIAWALACAALAACIALAVALRWRHHDTQTPAPVAMLEHAPAGVRLSRGNSTTAVSGRTELFAGDVLGLGANQPARIVWNDGTRMDFEPNATITVQPSELAEPGIYLGAGAVAVSAAKQPPDRRFTIRTDSARISVIGTRFSVDARQDSTRVDVTEGRVRIETDDDAVELAAHEYTIAAAGAKLLVMPIVQNRLALFVTDSLELNAADDAVRRRITSMGYQVRLKTAREVLPADADACALVLVSTTVHSSVDTQVKALRDIRVPLVTWEISLFKDFGMAGARAGIDSGESPARQRVAIVNPDHPMAAGLKGAVEVFSKPLPMRWVQVPPGAQSIAVLDDRREAVVLFGFEAGAAIVGGRAPARRVGLYMYDEGAADFTAKGWILFDAAIYWAVGDPRFK